ncbi:thioredoxin domain-containing protein 11-like [Paramacrobiotus metropolitanus]|uniref:thioredoxin domain-containing protein 11-like n=1 Tax=Paramacrobiotus metropolitanus TaxID=2943436 RepID=UPI0024462227|nr:thioredoxin domain-containing protein 11-like [Paramacrobiotus metropolitanus]
MIWLPRGIYGFVLLAKRKIFKHPIMRDTGMCLLVSLLWMLLNTFRHSATHEEPLLTVPGKSPERFFSKSAAVRDYYRGELVGLAQNIQANDITVTFFYATWCIASAEMRPVFEDAARSFKDQASFVAVNCAIHGSQCAAKRRPDHFPLVGAFIRRRRNMFIPYRGYPSADHFGLFLERLVRPFVRIDSRNDFFAFVDENDLAVVASLDLTEPRGLDVLWNTSLLIMRHDPRHDVKFAVITNTQLFQHLGFTETNIISIIRTSNVEKAIRNFHLLPETTIEEAILPFILKKPIRWLFPMFHRSTALAEVTRNATLVAFMPYDARRHCNPLYETVRRISHIYHDCEKKTVMEGLLELLKPDSTTSENRCRSEGLRCDNLSTKFAEIGVRRGRLRRSNCMCIGNSSDFNEDVCWMRSMDGSKDSFQNAKSMPPVYCDGRHKCSSGVLRWRKYSACCYSQQLQPEFDLNVPLMQMDACRNLKQCCDNTVRHSFHPTDLPKLSLIHGLGCRTNRSLNVIAIDSMTYPAFLDNLGLALGQNHSRFVIVDKPSSEKYIFPGDVPLTWPLLVDFIYNYTRNTLESHRRSADEQIGRSPPGNDEYSVKIEEISGGNFSNIFDLEEDIVMLYYASWCTFCKAVMSVYFNVAAKFFGITGIKFARINIQKNELPWEYRIIEVPTLQIFSGKRKRDNIATFPRDVLITPLTLLKFILLHVDTPVWRGFVSDKCDSKCWNANRAQAIKLRRISRKNLAVLRSVRSNTRNKEALIWKIIGVKRRLRSLSEIISKEEAHIFFRKFLSSSAVNMSSKWAFRNLVSSRFLS